MENEMGDSQTDADDVLARRQRSNKISAVMSERLLQGHRMLASNCPDCGNILMEDKRGSQYCVACREVDEQPFSSSATPPATRGHVPPGAADAGMKDEPTAGNGVAAAAFGADGVTVSAAVFEEAGNSDEFVAEKHRNMKLQNELLETQIAYLKLKTRVLKMYASERPPCRPYEDDADVFGM